MRKSGVLRRIVGIFGFMALFTLLSPQRLAVAGVPPADWQVNSFRQGGKLTSDGTVEYDSGTWNLRTGPSRSEIVSKFLNNDISVVMQITDANGDANSHLGIMMWSSLSPAAGKAGLTLDPTGQNICFSWDEAADRGTFYANYLQTEGFGFPVWLKLTRAGSFFSAFYSRDGRDWRPVGVPIKTFWAGKRPEIFAGAYADGVGEVRLTNLQIAPASGSTEASALPKDWSVEIHGEPEFVGEAKFAEGKWVLAGGSPRGRGGYHNVTVLSPVPARVKITARIRTADLSAPQIGGGLLLSAHGVDASVMAFPADGRLEFFTRRNSDGRLLQNRTVPIPASLIGKAEAYLRLDLVDGRVTAYHGASANDWTPIGDGFTVNEMSADVSGGMELAANSGSRSISTVSFEDFQATPITAKPPPVRMAAAPAVRPPYSAVPRPSPASSSRPTPAPYTPRVKPHTSLAESIGSLLSGLLCFGIVILVFAAIVFVKPYNKLVLLRNRTRNAWAQIDVQLKRRHDLILNFVEVVKGYAKHERGTLEGVTEARAAAISANSVEDRAKAENALSNTMRSLYAVVEAYPDLKANQNFLSLQNNLTNTEDKLAAARENYNNVVLAYNTEVQSFPINIVATIFRFKERDFFEVKLESEREAPKAGT